MLSVNPRAKLSPEQVLEIFRRAHAGERTGELAAEFGVGSQAVSSIKAGRKWRSVTGHVRLPVATKPTEPVKPQRRNFINETTRALKEAYSDRAPLRRKPPKPRSLEEMLSGNSTALALLQGAAQRRAEREAEERARIAEQIESWDRLVEARDRHNATQR